VNAEYEQLELDTRPALLKAITTVTHEAINAAREFTGYELERTADGSTFKSGYPDKDNHTIDAVRYACERDMQKGGYIAQLPGASDKLGAHQSYWRR